MVNLFNFFGGFMVSPTLFFIGVAAIASPIIIHLLNKRKFKRVDWAAMDFLLEADKKNRRRVRLENLILLLLRCLACILIGLLLARLFIPLGMTAGMFGAEEYERVVLLDDSLSMSVKNGSETSMESAKAALADFVRGLADNGSSDKFTLYLTSDPTHPVPNGEQIDAQKATEIAADLADRLRATDRPANMAMALLEVEKGLEGKTGSSLNQIVYIISDMRQGDWPTDEAASEEQGVAATLRRIAKASSGCFLVDVGREDDAGNVFVQQIQCKEKALVAGVPCDFDVTVSNTGKQVARNVKVKFVAGFEDGGETPLEETVAAIPAGGTETIGFQFAFSADELAASEELAVPARIRAEVLPGGVDDLDELAADNTRYFAARVAPGIRTLIVDGDILPNKYDSESYFLEHALSPPGNRLSGMAVDVVSESEFEHLRLDDYQVIYLCNLFRIPERGDEELGDDLSASEAAGDEAASDVAAEKSLDEPQRKRLSRREQVEKWVADGGGLVIAMGEGIVANVYNEELYRDGKGLLPVKLDSMLGEVDESKWVHFIVENPHPVMKAYYGEEGDNFSEFVKIFRWWDCTIAQSDLKSGAVNVVARFDNPAGSPAVVEKQFGNGRVFLFTTPLDLDWSDWPQEYSYLPTMIELNKYLARQTSDDANVQVGDPIRQPLDLEKYDPKFSVKRPDQETAQVNANPSDEESSNQTLYGADYDNVDGRGFYEMLFTRLETGEVVPMLFAANIDPAEGDLSRADTRELQRKWGDAKVEFISQRDLLNINVEDARRHLWPYVLMALVGILCLEQFLGWRFGRNR